ncbi:Alpha/Beta hydrolase protein [Gloeopeniophorella convolvens]|nr:Alpha/Beta hydrolase protein [Gloeopeniophorella convolvens]
MSGTTIWGLPSAIRSRTLQVNDLNLHVLEAGESPNPLILLLHGFPELSYSWRKVIIPLADAGYYVVAPDQRGYGRTTPISGSGPEAQPIRFEEDPAPYRMFNVLRDAIALVHALGRTVVHAVVGHDFGSPVAGFCALVRPDMFQRVVLMSAPFTGAPSYPVAGHWPTPPSLADLISRIRTGLGALDPARKHYTLYFSSDAANRDMRTALADTEQLRAFLRAYYHVKSADWAINQPRELVAPSAEALAVLPEYYIMRREATMPETVLRAAGADTPEALAAGERWLPAEELGVYVDEFWRTGFQGGLNWYRGTTDESGRLGADLLVFSGRRVEVPALFVAGAQDWGMWQQPGAVDRMRAVCARMGPGPQGVVVVQGAGHWVQQEQPDAVVRCLLGFFAAEA